MKVYIIEPEMTMEDPQKAILFINDLKKQLNDYAIETYVICKANLSICKTEINKNTLVILFNDNINFNDEINTFLFEAKKLML